MVVEDVVAEAGQETVRANFNRGDVPDASKVFAAGVEGVVVNLDVVALVNHRDRRIEIGSDGAITGKYVVMNVCASRRPDNEVVTIRIENEIVSKLARQPANHPLTVSEDVVFDDQSGA